MRIILSFTTWTGGRLHAETPSEGAALEESEVFWELATDSAGWANRRWQWDASGDKPTQAKPLLQTKMRLFMVSKRHKLPEFDTTDMQWVE